MQICSLEQYGVPIWSVSPLTQNLLATGTWTGSTNEPQSLLRISSYDINKGFNILGMTLSPTKFSSLDWTDFNSEYGIIAGGMGDGAITLWDARKVLDGSSGNNNELKMGRGCVSAANIHNGVPVNSIEFNPHKKNLLASGGAEVLIQDISHNIKQPNVFKPGVPNYHQGSRITSISWNRIVSHILASASENGKIVVWDLKVNKSIFTFTEPQLQQNIAGGADDYYGDYFGGSGMDQQNAQKKAPQVQLRETSMVWNPEIPTQFLTVNDDDQNPSMNIWDLRNPDYPVATYQDLHYNGILSVAWSQSDPNLIISSSKDYRTVVVNSKTGEKILEFPTQQQFNKISWSRPLKGKVCAMDTEGNTSILSLQPEGLHQNPNSAFATPVVSQQTGTTYAPKWLQPKSGVRFGFGNRLVTFGGSNGSLIKIMHKPAQPTLAQKILNFDQSIETMEITQLLDQKINESQNEIDKLEFTVMKCIHKNKYDDLFKMFGYDKTKVVQEVEKYLGKKLLKPKQEQQVAQPLQQQPQFKQEFAAMTEEDASKFFEGLGSRSQAGANQSNQQTNNNNEEQKLGEAEEPSQHERKLSFATETVSKNMNWDEGIEGIIKRNLLIGNLEYAAEVAMKAGRTTEALLIAEAGGEKLFEKIKEEYFLQSKDSYIKLYLRSIVQDDFKELVTTNALHHKNSNWRENLAYIISYLEGDDMRGLVRELSEELMKKKDINSAIICFMISQSLDIVIDLWKKRTLYFIKKGVDRNEMLFQLFEKCILFKTVCGSKKAFLDLDLIISDMAEYMAQEDLRVLGMKYLQLCNPSQPNVAFAKDRIFNSDSINKVNIKARPPVPYQIEKIKVHMSIYARQQQQQTQFQKQGQIQGKQMQGSFQGAAGGPIAGGTHGHGHVRQGAPLGQQQNDPYQGQVQQQQYQNPQNPQQQQQLTKQNRPTGGYQQDQTILANFGYSNKTAVVQNQPQANLGKQQIQPPLPQQQHQPMGGQNFGGAPLQHDNQVRPGIPTGIRGPPPPILGQKDQVRPHIFNPTDVKKQEEVPQQIVPPPSNKQQQNQPKQQIRPPPIGQVRPPGPGSFQQPQGAGQMDQGRPLSSHNQRMPPPPTGMNNQLTPRNDIQPPPIHQQQEQVNQFSPQPQQQQFGQPPPPMNQGQRPRGPPPGGFRPPVGLGGPAGANQQIGQTPPLGGNQAPPMGGPRPGAPGGIRPQMQQQQVQQQNMMAGSGGSADSPQEVLMNLNNLLAIYQQVETNVKAKQDNESKFQILRDRLQEGSVSQPVLGLLKAMTSAADQGNFQGVSNFHRELTQKYWNESKDWANPAKIIINAKQRYTS